MLTVFPTQLLASEQGIFFNISSARKLGGDLDFYKKIKTENDEIIKTLDEENNQYLNLSNEYKEKILFLEKDKEILKVRGDKFEDVYISTSKDLIKCKDNTPSRVSWYTYGVISTLIAITVGLFALK